MILNALAWRHATAAFAGLRDGANAIELATEACEQTRWKSAEYIDTLAAAYAETGNFEGAVQFERRALALEAFPFEHKLLENHLSLFLRHLPCREYFEGQL